MGVISEEKIAEVRDRVDLAAIVGKRVELKRTGRTLKGLCPFHNERSPSFHVSPDRGFYHCFGCQASGDVFKFIMETEQKPFPIVVKELAQQVGIDIPEEEEAPDERRARERREWLYRVNDYVNEFYIHALWNDQAAQRARDYIAHRRLTEDTAHSFCLGYAPRRADALIAYLDHKKVPKGAAVELGVIGARDDGSYYVRLFDRLIFPIYDERDRIAGFGGRILEADAKAAKYINSPESAIFKKSRLLYGYTKAKNAIARKGGAWLCEGYLDVIALHQAGLEQAVAPLGTAMTPDHLPLLRRLTQRVVTMFDGDGAGLRATRRASELLLANGFITHVLAVPDGDDPDTLVLREGADAVQKRADDAPSAAQFFIDQAAKDMRPTVEGKVAAARELGPLLEKIGSQLERDLYVREAAKKFAIDPEVLKQHFGYRATPVPHLRPVASPAVNEDEPPVDDPEHPRVEPPDAVEWRAVFELLKYRAAWDALPQLGGLIEHEGLRQIVLQCIQNDAELTYEDMAQMLGSPLLARNLAAILCEDLSPAIEPAQLKQLTDDVILDVEHYLKKRELRSVQQLLAAADKEEVPVELLKRSRELSQWIKRQRPRLKESPFAVKR